MSFVDQGAYRRFCGPSILEKSMHSLLGIVEGITADRTVTTEEISLLNAWLGYHRPLESNHPFNEVIPRLAGILADGILDPEEKEDLLWLARKILRGDLAKSVKTDFQELHGLLQGIIADGVVNQEELQHLHAWLDEHEHLRRMWPFDEIEALIVGVLGRGAIDPDQQRILLDFFGHFCEWRGSQSPGEIQVAATGVCAVCPAIEFTQRKFCLTGTSQRYFRSHFEKVIMDLGGVVKKGVTRDLDYLILGAEGNPCWAYSCYGRKVEQAMNYRRAGSLLLIVHENDFHDAIVDRRG